MKKFFQQIWATPKVHGLVMAIASGVLAALEPYATSFYTYFMAVLSGAKNVTYQIPSFSDVWHIVVMAIIAASGAYAYKQGWLGSSNITPQPTK